MDPAECPICFVPITRRLSFAECGHQLCLTCGVRWLFKKSFCPLCRIPSATLLVVDSQASLPAPAPALLPEPSLEFESEKEASDQSTKIQQKPLDTAHNKAEQKSTGSDRESCREREMSLPELISTYWKDASVQGESGSESEKGEEGQGMEDVDISVFRGDLEQVIGLTRQVEDGLEEFDNHIFYSDLFDVVADIKRANEYYLEGLNERDPSISKYHFACFVEFVFKFLNELNRSLNDRDMPLINYLLSVVDEVYYNSYMEYHFRGYEPSLDELEI